MLEDEYIDRKFIIPNVGDEMGNRTIAFFYFGLYGKHRMFLMICFLIFYSVFLEVCGIRSAV
jgi:hypothetical protein